MRPAIVVVASIVLAGGLANVATAAPAATFGHRGGNEWWVEAVAEPKPQKMEAMDTGGSWKLLEFKSWGEWAGSFHIEPGHDVRFRATYADGVVESCWFE